MTGSGGRDGWPQSAVSALTLFVEDLDAARDSYQRAFDAELLNGPMDQWWGPGTASFQHPAGHVWEIAQKRY
jgi:uncharacterized glyoxalase superfamily protein PhnB